MLKIALDLMIVNLALNSLRLCIKVKGANVLGMQHNDKGANV